MKIARNLTVSGWYIEWYSPFPAPSLRELLSAAKLRECRSLVAPGPWFTHRFFIGSEIFEQLRSSGYTPSVSHSLDSSLREGAGRGCVPFNRVLAKIRGYGRFSSPLRKLREFDTVPLIGGHSLREGAGAGCGPFIGVLAKIRGYGRFSSPLRRAGSIHRWVS